jgi:hypothetical protein
MSGLIYSDPSVLVEETKRLITIQNIWVTIFAGPFIFLVKDKPRTPPSSVATQNQQSASSQPPLTAAFKQVLSDRNFVYLLTIFALIDGEFISFSSIMSILFDYYNAPECGTITNPT